MSERGIKDVFYYDGDQLCMSEIFFKKVFLLFLAF